MKDYWESLNKEERKALMESIYVHHEIGNLRWAAVPRHIRAMLYSLWNNKWRNEQHPILKT